MAFCKVQCLMKRSPEVPQVPFAGGQLGQGGEDLFQDELAVLLVAGKHLDEVKMNTER